LERRRAAGGRAVSGRRTLRAVPARHGAAPLHAPAPHGRAGARPAASRRRLALRWPEGPRHRAPPQAAAALALCAAAPRVPWRHPARALPRKRPGRGLATPRSRAGSPPASHGRRSSAAARGQGRQAEQSPFPCSLSLCFTGVWGPRSGD